MRKATIILALASACAAVGTGRAQAQVPSPSLAADGLIPRGYLDINVGAQPQRQTIEASSSFKIYDETATVTASQHIRNGGIVEFRAGARVKPNLAVGLGVSQFGRPGSASVTASIPSPSIFNRAVTQTKETDDLAHKELSFSVPLTWFVPLTDKFDVAISAGPTYILLTQDVATTVTVPPGSQDFNVNEVEETGHALGVNFGADGNYMFSRSIGVGLFVHYVYGNVDLESATDVTVGGFQVGLGMKVRF